MGLKLEVTEHAKQRARERGIELPEAVPTGVRWFDLKSWGERKFRLGPKIVVVVQPRRGGNWRVKTVYWTS